ncbi:MAG: PRC-barrel domain-containing protein [Thermoplasmata archaeon]
MKKFITELRGKTVMTNDGQILGVVDNFVVDSLSGEIEHMLVVPAEELDTRGFKLDNQNRIILPFKSMKAVKDVIVMDLGGQ